MLKSIRSLLGGLRYSGAYRDGNQGIQLLLIKGVGLCSLVHAVSEHWHTPPANRVSIMEMYRMVIKLARVSCRHAHGPGFHDI